MPECELCHRAELTPWQRFKEDLLSRFQPPAVTLGNETARMGRALSFMIGDPLPDWYVIHRERWIKTGDLRELIRMDRHTPPSGDA